MSLFDSIKVIMEEHPNAMESDAGRSKIQTKALLSIAQSLENLVALTEEQLT